MTGDRGLTLADLAPCFEGAVPAVIATADAAGTPNITYLSRVRMVDADHVALSNQFFSKTVRNLTERPRASVLLIDPLTYDEYRLTVVHERSERRGPVFERLRDDVDNIAAITGMEGIFRLRGADIYRVLDIEDLAAPGRRAESTRTPLTAGDTGPSPDRLAAVAELTGRLGRAGDLDTLVQATVDGLASLLGYPHSMLLLLDEDGRRLFTIASHGYDDQGVGSEVPVGEGIIGMAAARAAPMRVGNFRQLRKYGLTVRRSFEDHGEPGPGHDVALPGLPDGQSRLAVPVMALGRVTGVLTVESSASIAFDETDEAVLGLVAGAVAAAIAADATEADTTDTTSLATGAAATPPTPAGDAATPATRVRFFTADGSTFLDGDYLIKGVAGRLLWALLGHHQREGRTEFTNRELRLDPTLELPEFRDNFESRLILLKRRLDERAAPIRIDKTGRGRFRLTVDTALHLEQAD